MCDMCDYVCTYMHTLVNRIEIRSSTILALIIETGKNNCFYGHSIVINNSPDKMFQSLFWRVFWSVKSWASTTVWRCRVWRDLLQQQRQHRNSHYTQKTMFTAGARRPGGAVLDQVYWRREANTETLKVTQAYQRLQLTMTTTFTKLALSRATTFTKDCIREKKYLYISILIIREFQ